MTKKKFASAYDSYRWKNRESERAGTRFSESGNCRKTTINACALTRLGRRRRIAIRTGPFGPEASSIGQSGVTNRSGAALGIRGPHGERVSGTGIHRGSTTPTGREAAKGA